MILDIITTERGIFNGRKTSEYKTQTYKPGRACPRGCRKDDIIGRPAFKCGRIRKIGRVDHKDAYLDTYELERERGITIFSKQAVFSMGDMEVTLLDTPGACGFFC